MNRLDGKVALVTGAGSGIGKTVASAMATEGARVAALDIESDWANLVTTEIKREGGEAIAICADVSSKDEVSAGVQACANRWGRLARQSDCEECRYRRREGCELARREFELARRQPAVVIRSK